MRVQPRQIVKIAGKVFTAGAELPDSYEPIKEAVKETIEDSIEDSILEPTLEPLEESHQDTVVDGVTESNEKNKSGYYQKRKNRKKYTKGD